MKKILLVAGGTGGHYFPAESILEECSSNGYNAKLITDLRCKSYISYPLLTKIIAVPKLHGNLISKIMGILRLPISIAHSLYFMYQFKPDLLIAFGGYTSLPHVISAKLLRIPIAIHEQNSVIGKANLLFCKFAKLIFLSYKTTMKLPSKYKSNSIFTGNFVRKKLLNIKSSKDKSHFTILVLGGSQGAKIFSTKITEALIACSKTHKNLKVIQQVINSDIESVKKHYSENSIIAEINSFFKDIEEKYIEADLIIARSGASTIAEIIALKKPAILIPIPGSADNHQYFNAKLLEDESACILLEQKNIESDLKNILNKILEDKSRLSSMQDRLEELQINGTQILFHSIKKLFN